MNEYLQVELAEWGVLGQRLAYAKGTYDSYSWWHTWARD